MICPIFFQDDALISVTVVHLDDGGGEEKMFDGFVPDLTYPVVELLTVGTARLCRLRNPWGRGEWTGPWSNAQLSQAPIIVETTSKSGKKSSSSLPPTADNSFYISLEDLCSHFHQIDVYHLEKKWQRHVLYSAWGMEDVDGKCDPRLHTEEGGLVGKPQFRLSLSRDSEVG